jgi:REP element-mobilizing transposase RayT
MPTHTHTQLIYHIVFSTKYREPTIEKDQKKRLFAFIYRLLINKKCHLYRINGVEDHIHIVTHIPPSLTISSLVKDIKVSSGLFIQREAIFKNFKGWQNGYGAFTAYFATKDRLINYVKNQEVHHQKKSFFDEYKGLLEEHGIAFDQKFLR